MQSADYILCVIVSL